MSSSFVTSKQSYTDILRREWESEIGFGMHIESFWISFLRSE